MGAAFGGASGGAFGGARRAVDVLLIGGGVASVRCARTLRRRGFTGSILLVAEEPHLPYNRPPLSKELLRGEAPVELAAAEPEAWYARNRVELLTAARVSELHPGDHLALLADGSSVLFGNCLLATGAAPRHPPVPGGEEALVLRSLDQMATLRGRASAAGVGAPAVVVGGGFIGVEAAASLAALGLRPTVLELAGGLWGATLGDEVSTWASASLEAAGVDVRLRAGVTRLERDGVWVDAEHLASALTLAGVGVLPRSQLAEAAGIDVGDGIIVDDRRQTSAPGVFAAGDVARAPLPLADGAAVRVEHWHAARESGEAAALGILGEPVPAAKPPWVYSEFADQLLDVVGWAPDWDDTHVIGDPDARGDDDRARFAIAYLRSGVATQLAIVNGALVIEEARALIATRPDGAALDALEVVWRRAGRG
ncbi:MAG: FAD-dependent oxidoreductase [Chloroflexota bacterium]|nr:FAD-dependent oxidoreductase [Chloroflexota bacterium]